MENKIPFHKYHGAGNDFILFDGRLSHIKTMSQDALSELARRVCHRRFGIGADGIMVATLNGNNEICMHYLNSDGSLAKMCGNGLRCFSRFVYEIGMIKADSFTVHTGAGPLKVTLNFEHEKVKTVCVNMGVPNNESVEIGTGEHEMLVNGLSYSGTTIEMGVPHTVIQVSEISTFDVCGVGAIIEKLPIFPQRTNVNFVEILDRSALTVHTWERGAGFTLACGTGVCASVAVLYHKGLCDNQVVVTVPGGVLSIEIDNHDVVWMTGEACHIASGDYYMEVEYND